jgi:hypothetical protein
MDERILLWIDAHGNLIVQTVVDGLIVKVESYGMASAFSN